MSMLSGLVALIEGLAQTVKDGLAAREVWGSWQNLTEDRKPGELPWNGRARLHFRGNSEVGVEWDLGLSQRAVRLGFDVDRADADVGLWVALPGAAFWVNVRHPTLQKLAVNATFKGALAAVQANPKARIPWKREWSVRLADSALAWCFGDDPDNLSHFGDHRDNPKWKRGYVDLSNVILGARRHERVPVGDLEEVTIPLHEGTYPATVQLFRMRTWRENLPALTLEETRTAHVEIDVKKLNAQARSMPMFPGKGENSYDLGDDCIFSTSCPADNTAQAVASYVESVMKMRLKRGGRIDWRPNQGDPIAQA